MWSPWSLSALIEANIEDVKDMAPGLHVESRAEPGIVVHGDCRLLEMAIQNLTSNAVKYNVRNGLIRYSLTGDKNRAVLSITNTTDMPITGETMERVFDRFYRLDGSLNGEKPGHGLGLSIAKEIILAHNGELGIQKGEDKTVTFTMALPRAPR